MTSHSPSRPRSHRVPDRLRVLRAAGVHHDRPSRLDGGDFTAAVAFDRLRQSAPTTASRRVTIPTPVAGDIFTLTVDGIGYTSSSAATADAAATDFAGQVDALSGVHGVRRVRRHHVTATTPGTDARLTLDHTSRRRSTPSPTTSRSSARPADTNWHLGLDARASTRLISGTPLGTVAGDLADEDQPASGSLYFAVEHDPPHDHPPRQDGVLGDDHGRQRRDHGSAGDHPARGRPACAGADGRSVADPASSSGPSSILGTATGHDCERLRLDDDRHASTPCCSTPRPRSSSAASTSAFTFRLTTTRRRCGRPAATASPSPSAGNAANGETWMRRRPATGSTTRVQRRASTTVIDALAASSSRAASRSARARRSRSRAPSTLSPRARLDDAVRRRDDLRAAHDARRDRLRHG